MCIFSSLSDAFSYLADPGEARGCSTNTFVITWVSQSVSQSVSHPFPPTALWRWQAQTVRDSSFSYKIDYFIGIQNFLNPERHQNSISGSKVTVGLLKVYIFGTVFNLQNEKNGLKKPQECTLFWSKISGRSKKFKWERWLKNLRYGFCW